MERNRVVPEATIQKVIAQVHDSAGERDAWTLGCVPLENSIQGSVTTAWDTLGRLNRPDLESPPISFGASHVRTSDEPISSPKIVASLTLSIEQFLLTSPGTNLSEVTEVLSHPQGLAQCTDWLHRYLPQARQTAVASTADAARMVAENKNSYQAAIGPRGAGALYGLERSSESVQNSALNQTRFGLIAISSRKPAHKEWTSRSRWTFSIVLVGVANAPGGLYRTLEPFHNHFNLTRIESRPVGSQLGRYLFFLDLEWPYGDRQPETVEAWLAVEAQLTRTSVQVVQLGLYPEVGVSK